MATRANAAATAESPRVAYKDLRDWISALDAAARREPLDPDVDERPAAHARALPGRAAARGRHAAPIAARTRDVRLRKGRLTSTKDQENA